MSRRQGCALDRTNRTFSGLSRNNAAFNNGCLLRWLSARIRGCTRRKGWIRGETGRRRRWKGGKVAERCFRAPMAFQKLPWRSTRASLIRVDDIRPVCHDISSIQDTNHPRQPRPPGNSTRGGGSSLRRTTIFRNLRGVVLRFHAPFRAIRRPLRFSPEGTLGKNFLNFSTLPVGFGLAITPVFLVDAIRFHEWNDCHAAWRDIDVTPRRCLEYAGNSPSTDET